MRVGRGGWGIKSQTPGMTLYPVLAEAVGGSSQTPGMTLYPVLAEVVGDQVPDTWHDTLPHVGRGGLGDQVPDTWHDTLPHVGRGGWGIKSQTPGMTLYPVLAEMVGGSSPRHLA